MQNVYLGQTYGALVDHTFDVLKEEVPKELEDTLFAKAPPVSLVVRQAKFIATARKSTEDLLKPLTDKHIAQWLKIFCYLENKLSEAHTHSQKNHSLKAEVVELRNSRCCFGATKNLLDYPLKFSMNRAIDTPTHDRINDKLRPFKHLWILLGVKSMRGKGESSLPPKYCLRTNLRSDKANMNLELSTSSLKVANLHRTDRAPINFHRDIWNMNVGPSRRLNEGEIKIQTNRSYPREAWQTLWDYMYETPDDQRYIPELSIFPQIMELARELDVNYLEKYYEAVLEDSDMNPFPTNSSSDINILAMPNYWQSQSILQNCCKHVRLDPTSDAYHSLKHAMQNTACGGNCPQIFDIEWIERIENPLRWKIYSRERESIRDRRKISNNDRTKIQPICPRQPLPLEELAKRNKLEMLALNEMYLFHGTHEKWVKTIADDEGFDERLCKRGRYGDGIYGAQNVCKSDQYTDRGYIFVMRAVVGNPWYVTCGSRAQVIKRPQDPVNQDCLIANIDTSNNGVNSQQHREFVFFDR
eukprot:CAMPEP_0113322306 /NCGR_PEP_ID=MMETSP0010_2-20120614/15521_1 /TAXON_ID=216773 ORGANISM="Corethron hystrix, Strain 308" /NCGR_SAMPLE_ID=MMETSP0010_2 /ASSEMBLY_ACC=CAM_ASM_000155 /LENGTH=527 /DNA_ID=CAMNT_0000180769 /DNA_START=246 /DNA_END=1826 /DNA_ORIENTATION=- /assembly_acc=CAM_ASM_000155